jgi:hypothetical protein
MACIREYGTCAGILTIIRLPPSATKLHSQAGKKCARHWIRVAGPVATPTVTGPPPTCKNSTTVFHALLHHEQRQRLFSNCPVRLLRCSFNCAPPPACVARVLHRLTYERGEITLLRAFPASGPQSTFSLSTRCRRSDEVI